MIDILCASLAENLESEMRYEPICFSIKKSKYEHELVNLNDSSTVSNTTKITTATPTIFYTSDRKSLNFQGKIFIFNCPMPKKEFDYFTQMVHWTENDTTTTIVNGKEYVSSENGVKIYVFEVTRPGNNKTLKTKERVAISFGVIAAFYLGRETFMDIIDHYIPTVYDVHLADELLRRFRLLRQDGLPFGTRPRVRQGGQLPMDQSPDQQSIDTSQDLRRNMQDNRSSTTRHIERDIEEGLYQPLPQEGKEEIEDEEKKGEDDVLDDVRKLFPDI